MAKKATAAKETKDLAVTEDQVSDLALASYGDYGAAEGFDNTGRDDFAIPFINLLQKGSPQTEEDDAAYIEGAKPGMLINSVTGDLYSADKGLVFQPCYTQHCYVEWVPRNDGGGFVAIHQIDSPEVQKAKDESSEYGKYKIGANDLVETFYIYGDVLDEETLEVVSQAMMTFTSTKIKVYKAIMTKIRSFQVAIGDGRKICPPLFAHKLRITSVKQQKNQDKFFNFKIEPANGSLKESLIPPGHELMELGQAFYKLVKSGEAKVDHGQGTTADVKKGTEEAPPF